MIIEVIYDYVLLSVFRFKKILNTFDNGALLYGVSRIRGIFEVVLIMYTHEDTAQVH